MQHSTTREAKQKICANLDHHWSKKCLFLSVQTNWVGPSRAQRFCKNDSDPSLESLIVTRVILWKTWLESGRVSIFLKVSRVESELPKIVTRVESSHWLESRYDCWCCSAHTCLVDPIINDPLWIVTGCLRPTAVDNLAIVATSPVVLRWLCDSPRTGCAWRTTPYIYEVRTSNNRVIMACELYCCLLPQCEALRIFRSGFPIATLSSQASNLLSFIATEPHYL